MESITTITLNLDLQLSRQSRRGYEFHCCALKVGLKFIEIVVSGVYRDTLKYMICITCRHTTICRTCLCLSLGLISAKFLQQNLFVIPVSFAKEHKAILAHTKELMEYQNGLVAIHPRHNKLIIALRIVVENGEGSLDVNATSHDDLMDAFRSSLLFWH